MYVCVFIFVCQCVNTLANKLQTSTGPWTCCGWNSIKNLTHLLLTNYELAFDLRYNLEGDYPPWTSSYQRDFFIWKFLNDFTLPWFIAGSCSYEGWVVFRPACSIWWLGRNLLFVMDATGPIFGKQVSTCCYGLTHLLQCCNGNWWLQFSVSGASLFYTYLTIRALRQCFGLDFNKEDLLQKEQFSPKQ